LSRGELRVIGATTRDEYERFIQPDAALERRFHPVEVVEMGRDQTLQVLRARRPRLEMHHTLVITDAAIEAAFAVSSKRAVYAARKHPDKSIDLIDEACAFYRLRDGRELPEEVIKMKTERLRLIAVERKAIDLICELANSHGSLIERFSKDTYNALEEVGLELERFFTGNTTPRPPSPVINRRLEETDPAADLAKAQRERLLVEESLRESLAAAGLIIDFKQIEEAGL
jgi:ATP-dependent Clp protease ATP-binding subunit ClpB